MPFRCSSGSLEWALGRSKPIRGMLQCSDTGPFAKLPQVIVHHVSVAAFALKA